MSDDLVAATEVLKDRLIADYVDYGRGFMIPFLQRADARQYVPAEALHLLVSAQDLSDQQLAELTYSVVLNIVKGGK